MRRAAGDFDKFEMRHTSLERENGPDRLTVDRLMRVGIYARVSTGEQNAETQLRDLRAYCVARHWPIEKEFVDVGISGSKEDRPALNELMACARKRKIDVLLVWRFDRFARSLRHLILCLTELRELGIEFVSYSEAVDTSTSAGRLVFNLVGSIAEFERDLIRERIQAGLRRAKAEGVRLGRPGIAFDVQEVQQLRLQGLSVRQIGAKLGIPPASVWRAFQNIQKPIGTVSTVNCRHKC